ncbi:hypothetical protein GT348_00520 [Aristophania vespae]|uniref:UPF0301 protein GT348_00520 n=1 Tax=Aristophania vespae TaxID=2697033 RepID=A0A6P1NBW4_9PROT|nr:YqgE/AlgH family protein [Aristophania vespae]QHI95003.1 hypothetical protein GT348_00520 [Aristophania vespae]UMM64176.1 hypothetical protein DM15PD_11710 [Aristophania vespae]
MTKVSLPSFSDLTGKILIACPQLAETIFGQSVVYLCDYSKEEGTLGVIINKRFPNLVIEDLFKQFGITLQEQSPALFLGQGGPVDPSHGFILHSLDWSGEMGGYKSGPACLTANLDILRDLVANRGPRHSMMVLGHAAWAPGQLEEEIFHNNYWFLAQATEELIFKTDPNLMWEKALASLGISPSSLSLQSGEG